MNVHSWILLMNLTDYHHACQSNFNKLNNSDRFILKTDYTNFSAVKQDRLNLIREFKCNYNATVPYILATLKVEQKTLI